MYLRQPCPQTLFGKRRHGGKTGGVRVDGSAALWEVWVFICVNPKTSWELHTINPITQSTSRLTKEQHLGMRQYLQDNTEVHVTIL